LAADQAKWREYLHWPVSFALVWRTRKFGTQTPLEAVTARGTANLGHSGPRF